MSRDRMTTTKEPWQMTREEWLKEGGGNPELHKLIVEEHLKQQTPRSRKIVPPEVLKDYPELAGKGKPAEVATPNITADMPDSYVQAKKRPDGKWQLYFTGTLNEVFPNQLYSGANAARMAFAVARARLQLQNIAPSTSVQVDPFNVTPSSVEAYAREKGIGIGQASRELAEKAFAQAPQSKSTALTPPPTQSVTPAQTAGVTPIEQAQIQPPVQPPAATTLDWDKLQPAYRKMILREAAFNEKLAANKWEDIEPWMQETLKKVYRVKDARSRTTFKNVMQNVFGVEAPRISATNLEVIHTRRSPQSRAMDEAQKHNVTIEPTSPRTKIWMHDQGRADIRGIDTPDLSQRRNHPKMSSHVRRLPRYG